MVVVGDDDPLAADPVVRFQACAQLRIGDLRAQVPARDALRRRAVARAHERDHEKLARAVDRAAHELLRRRERAVQTLLPALDRAVALWRDPRRCALEDVQLADLRLDLRDQLN